MHLWLLLCPQRDVTVNKSTHRCNSCGALVNRMNTTVVPIRSEIKNESAAIYRMLCTSISSSDRRGSSALSYSVTIRIDLPLISRLVPSYASTHLDMNPCGSTFTCSLQRYLHGPCYTRQIAIWP